MIRIQKSKQVNVNLHAANPVFVVDSERKLRELIDRMAEESTINGLTIHQQEKKKQDTYYELKI